MENQLKADFYKKLGTYIELPHSKFSNDQLWVFFKDWVGEEYWDELVEKHNELHNDMGYWFQDFGDFIFAFAENFTEE